MRKFANAWQDIEIVQRTVAQIPWRSNITLLDKLKDQELRLWYLPIITHIITKKRLKIISDNLCNSWK